MNNRQRDEIPSLKGREGKNLNVVSKKKIRHPILNNGINKEKYGSND